MAYILVLMGSCSLAQAGEPLRSDGKRADPNGAQVIPSREMDPARPKPHDGGPQPTLDATPDNRFAQGVYLNVAGFLQFGPQLSLEVGQRWAPLLRLRTLNAAPLPYVLASLDEDTLAFSWGAALGLRFYSSRAGSLRGFFVGAAAEFIRWATDEDDGKYRQVAVITYISRYLLPQFEIGYRWRWGRHGTFALGAGGGILVLMSADSAYDPSNQGAYLRAEHQINVNHNSGIAFGTLNVELGWLF